VGEEIRSHVDAAALIHGLDLMMRAAGHAEAEADGRNLIPEGMNAQLLAASFGDIRVSAGDLLDAASDGELDALILIGSDPMGDGLFSMQAKRAMGKVPLVQIGAIAGQTSEFANVMLPAAAYSEVEGTFINMEGRIRLAEHPLRSLGEERPLWKVMMRLVQAFGAEVPVVDLAELRARVEGLLPEMSAVWDDGVSDDWCLPVVRNREANSVPNAIEPAMNLDMVSRYSMYREGMWVRASSFLVEAGDIHALDDLLVHPNTLKDAGLSAGECKVRTASGDYDYHIGVREDVAEGVLFISKRGVAGDLSCEIMASLEGGQ